MSRVERNTPPPFPFNYFPCLRPLWERVSSLAQSFYTRFMEFYWGKPRPKESFYDAARLSDTLKGEQRERDDQSWQVLSRRVDTLINGMINLSGVKKSSDKSHPSGFPPFMQVGYYHDKSYIMGVPFLSVVLPRRQIVHFPRPLQEHLLRFTEEELELQFVVFKKPVEKDPNFSLIFHHLFFSDYPKLSQARKEISVGLFGAEGIKMGTGRSVPWEGIQKDAIIVHTDGQSYSHSPDNFRVQMDGKVGTFYVGASFVHCGDAKQNKAYGVMGVVLDLDDESLENPALKVEQRLQECKTLQEFIDGSEGRIAKLFTYNPDY